MSDPFIPQDRVSVRAPLLSMLLVLCGGMAYSVLGTMLGSTLFPTQSTGSLVQRDGRVIGSLLLAQPFADARYIEPRPSAAAYDPMAAAGSNQARSDPALQARVAARIAMLAARERVALADVPADLATQSGAGLDPHLSPQAVRIQLPRVARARGLDPARLDALLMDHIDPPQFGLLGAARVNVLQFNLALDAAQAPGLRENRAHGR